MKGYARFCYGLFGWLGRPLGKDKTELEETLAKARMDMTTEVYYAFAFTTTLLVSSIVTFALVFIDLLNIPPLGKGLVTGSIESLLNIRTPFLYDLLRPILENVLYFAILIFLLLLLICKLYFFGIRLPILGRVGHSANMKKKARAKTVDLYIPYASSFVAAMAASNATIDVIMKGLASQTRKCSFWEKVMLGKPERSVYPEIDLEATGIYNDIKVLGLDTVTAIKNSVGRAPSPKLGEFFQGIYSTITSGGNLKLYFLNASEKYMQDNKQEQRLFLDQLALTVESYIVIAIAMPIFLIIMMVITMWVSGSGGGGGDASAGQLYLIIFGLLPLIHSGFAFGLYAKAKRRT